MTQYDGTAKPNPANLKNRAAKIIQVAGDAERMAREWAPKGKHHDNRTDIQRAFERARLWAEHAQRLLTNS